MNKSDLQSAAQIIRDGHTFLIAGHTSPDGDCLGCITALAFALSGLGKKVFPVCLDGVPDLYSYLPGGESLLSMLPVDQHYDVGISVDSDRPDRLGPTSEALKDCDHIIAMDHHLDGLWESGTVLIDQTSASCGEIVYLLLRELGVDITPEIAECLLTAVITDTGAFRYTNVKASTLRIAADLVEAGASPTKITEKVYESRTISSAKLIGKALDHLALTEEGLVAYTYITRDDIDSSGSSDAESEGIVNFARSIRNTEIGILFRETVEGTTRVSLRASAGRDISIIARMFGGGGHKAAAGCTIEHPLRESIAKVLDAVKQCMEF